MGRLGIAIGGGKAFGISSFTVLALSAFIFFLGTKYSNKSKQYYNYI
jgi:high-affinity Fe2+/Pb2+ permease